MATAAAATAAAAAAATAATAAGGVNKKQKKCLKASWRRCYYPHRSRDSLSPVCRIKKKRQSKLQFLNF